MLAASGEDAYFWFIDIVNGLLTGTLLGGSYAVIAVGLSLIFGVMRSVNLAHGSWLVASAYLATLVLDRVSFSPFFTIAVVCPVMYVVGYMLQRFLLNRVSAQAMERRGMSANYGLMAPLLVSFGISIVIPQLLQIEFSADLRRLDNDLAFSGLRINDDLSVSTLLLIFFGVAVAVLAGLHVFLRSTNVGRALRAASDNLVVAKLMGIRTEHIYAVATGLSLGLVGLAGVMVGMRTTFQPFAGGGYLLVAFGVVVIGGLGSVWGCLVGGMILGIVQVLAGTYFGPSAQLVTGYALILFMLARRPQGLFAK